jgi:actin-like ATPase involved in cell morphogenesis
LNEPSVVAIDRYDGEVVSVGHKALKLLGREPRGIEVHRPIRSGTIFNFEVAQKMLRTFIGKVTDGYGGYRRGILWSAFPALRLRLSNVQFAMPHTMPAVAASIWLTKDCAAGIGAGLAFDDERAHLVSTSAVELQTSRSSLPAELFRR